MSQILRASQLSDMVIVAGRGLIAHWAVRDDETKLGRHEAGWRVLLAQARMLGMVGDDDDGCTV